MWSRVAGAAEGWGRVGVGVRRELRVAIFDPAADGAGCVTLTCSCSPRTGQGWARGERAGRTQAIGCAQAAPLSLLGRSGSPEDAAPTGAGRGRGGGGHTELAELALLSPDTALACKGASLHVRELLY